MGDLHVHAVDGNLSVTLGPERQVKITVGLGKTRNSTNGPERIDFIPMANATSTVVENRSLAKKGKPTQYMGCS